MSLFDHTPVTVTDAYGPSIHLDPVAMDNSALRSAGIRDVHEDATGVAVVVNATELIDAVLIRLAAHAEQGDVIDALADLDDAYRADHQDVGTYVRIVREAIGLPLRDTVTIALHGPTAVLLAERLIDEAGPAALAAREAITLTRADFIDHTESESVPA